MNFIMASVFKMLLIYILSSCYLKITIILFNDSFIIGRHILKYDILFYLETVIKLIDFLKDMQLLFFIADILSKILT